MRSLVVGVVMSLAVGAAGCASSGAGSSAVVAPSGSLPAAASSPSGTVSASVPAVVPPVGSQVVATPQAGVTVACPDVVHGDPGAIGFRGNVSAWVPSQSTAFSAVVRCELVTRVYPGLGSWQVEVAEVAYGNTSKLIAQLRTPDQPAAGACGMGSQYGYPWFVLVEADGRVDHPAMPAQGCGPLPAAVAALNQLQFTVVDAVRITVEATAAATSAAASSVPAMQPATLAAPDSASAQQPLPGPQVLDAALFAGGDGYVRTPQVLLWTDNLGKSWRNVTPPGLTAAQLQSAGIAVLPDGHQWVAVTPAAGSSSVNLLRQSSANQSWTSTRVPLGAMSISADAAPTISLSFTDPNNGWLVIGEQITHSGFSELLRTADGGATWTLEAGQSAMPDAGAIRFLTKQVGYLDALSTGAWWATRDAGRTWVRLQLQPPSAKKADVVNIISAPALAGDAIVLAASFTTPTVGDDDGVGIYRSTDFGATWTVQQLPGDAPNEEYHFAATADGSSYLLLREQPAPDFQTFAWVASRSTNRGESFTDVSSVHTFYPGPVTLADPNHLWTVGGANGCKTFKTDCWNTAGLIASNDGGATWRQVKLPT